VSEEITKLEQIARELRWLVVDTIYHAKDGHPGAALSAADIVAALYFHVMNIDPENPEWNERDRFILSKGHGCVIVYAALAMRGYFPLEVLYSFRSIDSILQGHPFMLKTPGIDMTSGSLGNGLGIAVGMEIARQYLGKSYFIYAIVGDGEMQEGAMWEAVRAAAKYKAANLIVFIDQNGWQASGLCDDVGKMGDLRSKFDDYGWHCQRINGHNMEQILTSIQNARNEQSRPSVIIADTVKGKGISCFENNNKFHKGVPSTEEWETARHELIGDTR
jgi:transketolase